MSYEYMTGLGADGAIVCPPGTIAHEGTCHPTVQPRIAVPAGTTQLAFPPAPEQWRKSFDECKRVGGQVVWSGGWQPSVATQVRAGISSRWCPQSGNTRRSTAPAEERERARTTGLMREMGPEWEKCCYPQAFVEQMEARDARLRAEYLASPEYQRAKEQQEQLVEQHRREMLRRGLERYVEQRPAVASAGSGCAEVQDGVTVRYPIPEQVFSGQARITEIVPSGCRTTGRFYDVENVEICCLPQEAAEISAPAADVQAATTNGEEKKIPWMWLAVAALGAGALMWVFKR